MYPVGFAKGMILRRSFDDRLLDSSIIALMLAERKRRGKIVEKQRRGSLLSILRQKLHPAGSKTRRIENRG